MGEYSNSSKYPLQTEWIHTDAKLEFVGTAIIDGVLLAIFKEPMNSEESK